MLTGCYPVVIWAAMMRVDMLQIALSLAGMLFAIFSVARPRIIIFAAISFVLAIYTKQTAIAGPAAAFAGLILVRPRVAITLAILCTGLGAATLGWLEWATAGGFLRHVLLYNINRFNLSGWRDSFLQFALLAAYILTAAIGAWRTARRLSSNVGLHGWAAADRTQTASLMLLAFLAIKTAMLATLLKSGASNNYMVEWLCGVTIFAALALRPVLQFAAGNRPRLPMLPTLLVLIGLPIQAWLVPNHAARFEIARSHEPALARLVVQVRMSPKPRDQR